jgi:hypothetical protein
MILKSANKNADFDLFIKVNWEGSKVNIQKTNEEELISTLDGLKSEYYYIAKKPLTNESRTLLNKLMMKTLDVERQLAAVRNEPYAILWDIPIDWEFSIFPSHFMLSLGERTILVYSVQKEIDSKSKSCTAFLTFTGCESCRLGGPNDETIEGHYLYGKGIDVGGSYLVKNSPWLKELRKMNSVHSQFNDDIWSRKKHYLIFFKDNTFECIADNVFFEVKNFTVKEFFSKQQWEELE